jgi:fructose-specific phosphotransferase system IIC component
MSAFFKLDSKDLFKGAVVAAFSGAAAFVMKVLERMIETQNFNISMKDFLTIPLVGIAAALGYLMKQLLTDEQGKLGGKL